MEIFWPAVRLEPFTDATLPSKTEPAFPFRWLDRDDLLNLEVMLVQIGTSLEST
ncbi:mitochondrial-targeted muts 1 [Corchorus olitorius]|uniref:Mitochondrial-targeted muts 1 n=1 Tax=Corchorus olitorius TaxID=93759 RepID=A0A1R3GDT6_9ROSI|nr:mitochondrial-targeted muts 1 [Corchorus olitorius]